MTQLTHLIRRFYGFVTARPLGPREQAEVVGLLTPEEAELFWSQHPADQRHAIEVAHRTLRSRPGSRTLARAGLLHDIGKLVLWTNFPEAYDRILENSTGDDEASEVKVGGFAVLLTDTLGQALPDASAHLSRLWVEGPLAVHAAQDLTAPGDSLVVAGEGTWSVNTTTGVITFTPEAGFTGDPTPISYTVDDNDGNTSNEATVTVTYGEAPVAQDDTQANPVIGSPTEVDVLANDGAVFEGVTNGLGGDADVPAEALADRLPAAKAPPTFATHQIEAGGGPIAFGQTTDTRSEADNLTGDLMAEDMREPGGSFADSVSDREVAAARSDERNRDGPHP